MESLARGGPWRMGMILRNKSKWRALGEEETEKYGGSHLRRLYGCVFTMQHAPPRAVGCWRSRRASDAARNEPVQEFEQRLLTWSQVLHFLSVKFC